MADAGIDPSSYDQMWVQAHRLSGGARTQLELPRGSHRFFGPAYEGYDYERVEHIAEPSLVSGQRMWRNRPVTWHGDNRMERINLPSAAMGGYAYENSLILFRRMEPNAFLLIHEAQQGCRDATYEPSRFPVAVPYPSPHRATPAYVVVTSSDLDTSRNKASVSGFSWISRNAFELRVYPWESDAARSYVEASRLAGLVFRVGGRGPRFAGLLA